MFLLYRKQISFIAEEIKDPTRNIPKALLLGIFTVTVVYLLTNVAYFLTLDAVTVASSNAIAVTFAIATWGPIAAVIIPFAVSISTFGALSGGFFSAARVSFSAAREGHLHQVFSFVTVESCVPIFATGLRCFLAVIFTFAGSVSFIIDSAVFLETVWDIATVVCLVLLRYTMKDAPRPYSVPLVLVFLRFVISVFLVVVPLINPTGYLQYAVVAVAFATGAVSYVVFVRLQWCVPRTSAFSNFLQRAFLCVPAENVLDSMLDNSKVK